MHNEISESSGALPQANSSTSGGDDLEAARHKVNVAKAQFKADLSRVSSVSAGAVARRAWVKSRPAIIVGGAAVLGALVVYRLLASRRKPTDGALIRIVLVSRDTEQHGQPAPWFKLARSAGLSLGAALLKSWLSRVSESAEHGERAAGESALVEQPHAS